MLEIVGTYAYIPTNIEAIKKEASMNHDASFAFVARTVDGAEILKWFVLTISTINTCHQE